MPPEEAAAGRVTQPVKEHNERALDDPPDATVAAPRTNCRELRRRLFQRQSLDGAAL